MVLDCAQASARFAAGHGEVKQGVMDMTKGVVSILLNYVKPCPLLPGACGAYAMTAASPDVAAPRGVAAPPTTNNTGTATPNNTESRDALVFAGDVSPPNQSGI